LRSRNFGGALRTLKAFLTAHGCESQPDAFLVVLGDASSSGGSAHPRFHLLVGRFFSKTIRISLGKKDEFFFQGEIRLTKIVRREQNHLPKKVRPCS
jgi:hypothetical protein